MTNIINRRKLIKLILGLPLMFILSPKINVFGKGRGDSSRVAEFAGSTQNSSEVLRVHSTSVVSNNVKPLSYLDAIDTEKLDDMLAVGLQRFTGQGNLRQAWLAVLSNYIDGDRIAIKPNFNFAEHGGEFTITSPSLINSVVSQLVESLNVKPELIFIYDVCRKIPTELVRDRIDYPVNFIERIDSDSIIGKARIRLNYGLATADVNAEIKMRENIVDNDGVPIKCYLPQVITQAQHLINMPLLTNHIFIANSGSLKNHYGTVRFSNYSDTPSALHGSVMAKSIVDINRHPQIRHKTKLIIGDGLFGVYDRGEGQGKKKWRFFGKDFPKSIFLSRDPVAIDSVMSKIIIHERERLDLPVLSTEYLRDAMANKLGLHEMNQGQLDFKKINYSTLNV